MEKIVRLTERDLTRLVKRIINETEMDESILRFSDGEEFDTSGPIRKEKRSDGWYVLGGGVLIPVKNREEADEEIERLKRRKNKRNRED